MRFWIVQKQQTVEAVIKAIQSGKCKTEKQVERIAAKYGDTVVWSSVNEEGE